MEKRIKYLLGALLCIMLISTLTAAIVIQLYLSTRVKLIVPHDIRAEPMTWDWGNLTLWVDNDTAITTKKVTFTSYGAKPLTLSATVDLSSVVPTWFNTSHYSLDWTAEGYEIQPLEILETNFTLTVDVPLVREYMIAHQINETDIIFDIIVDVSDIPLTHYNLTIETTFGGTTDPAPGVHDYVEGEVAWVLGVPDIGYTVDCWDLDGVNDTANPISVLMDADHSLTAYFKEAELHDANAMWIEPSLIADLSMGDKFNVTVWLNATGAEIGCWQFKMLYDKNQLKIVRTGLTGTAGFKSQFFENTGTKTYAMDPAFEVYNETHDYVLYGESWASGPWGTGVGSLAWIEFEIIAEPPFTCMLDISTCQATEDTYIQSPTLEIIPLNVYDCICTLKSPAAPAH